MEVLAEGMMLVVIESYDFFREIMIVLKVKVCTESKLLVIHYLNVKSAKYISIYVE